MIYADNAATTRLDPIAFESMKPYLIEEYGNASQPYSFARSAKWALADARAKIAACIGADENEIYFTSGGTESDNWVIKGSAETDQEEREMITSEFEHHAILHACAAIERHYHPVKYLRPDACGIVQPELLEAMITDRTRLVSIMYANNEIGTVQPVEELARVAHEHGAVFHTDAVQAVGHIGINVHRDGIDLLSASAHKFNGPKGIGFLYCRNGIKIGVFQDGGAQEHGMRAGTENVASIAGMAAALEGNCRDLEQNEKKLRSLEQRLLGQLQNAGVNFQRNGEGEHIPGNMSMAFPGFSGEALLHRLDLKGICISTGSACDSQNTQISHVLKAIGLDEKYALGTVRISLGKYNTEDDVDAICEALKGIVLKSKEAR